MLSPSSMYNCSHYYCQTNRPMDIFTYTWEIPNFQSQCKILPLTTKFNPPNCSVIDSLFFEISKSKNDENLEFYISSSIKSDCSRLRPDDIFLFDVFLKNTDIKFSKWCSVTWKGVNLGSTSMTHLQENAAIYLPDNTLTVCYKCQICANKSRSVICTNIQYIESQEKNSNDNNDVVPDEESLVTFIIDDKRLYANKNLLCAKSTVFQAMFNCEMEEGVTNEVRITDINYDVLKLLLSYIQFTLLPNLATDDTKILSELLIAADKYNVQDLKLLCEFQVIKLIDSSNYVEFLDTTWLHDTKYLKDYINKFIDTYQENMHNSQLAKSIETNSEFPLHVTKYFKTDNKKRLSCSVEICHI